MCVRKFDGRKASSVARNVGEPPRFQHAAIYASYSNGSFKPFSDIQAHHREAKEFADAVTCLAHR